MRRPRPRACRISVLDGATATIRRASSGPLRFVRQPSSRITTQGTPWGYDRQPMNEQHVVVDLDVPATMRDGVRLRANVYRPPEGRWPVLLTRLPYGKDLAVGTSALDPVQAARRGYAVIVQDTRGRLASEGEFRPFATEAEDGVDTIAWAAGLPYSDGQVGMYGLSYFGFTQWSAALQQPAALKAMVPSMTWS